VLISAAEWRRRRLRYTVGSLQGLLLLALVAFGLGPILWLAKSAISPTRDTLSHPMAVFPHGPAWSNVHQAWSTVQIGHYFWNTVLLAAGSWLSQILVATTAGFALSVLRPKYAKVLSALLLTTLFVPVVVLLVPLYVRSSTHR